jgi:hypothetical protein
MIEFHGGDRSADPEHGTVRMYAYFFLTTSVARLAGERTFSLSPRRRRSRLVDLLYHMQESAFTKFHWFVYISKTVAQYHASSLPGIVSSNKAPASIVVHSESS